MVFTSKRLYSVLAGILLVILGLFLSNPIIGIIISLIIASFVFLDDKLGIFFLILFVPIRAFLVVYNSGFTLIGDIIILFLLVKVIIQHRHNLRNLFRFQWFEYAFFGFLLTGVIGAFITGVSLAAIITQVRAFALFYLMYYIVKRLKVTNQDVFEFSLLTVVFGLVLAIQGLVEKISLRTLLLPEVWQQMELAATNKIRIYGLMGGPNETAMFMITIFFIGLYLLKQATGSFKVFLYISLVFVVTAFILTFSRGAMLGLIAFVPIYLLLTRSLKMVKPILIIGVFTTVFSFSAIKLTEYVELSMLAETNPEEQIDNEDVKPPTANETASGKGMNRFKDAFSKEEISLSGQDGRVYYFKKSFEVFRDSPIIGHGFGTYGGSATLKYSSPIYEQYGIYGNFYSDNQYSQLIAETGIIGILLIFLFVLGLIKMTWDLRKGHPFSPILVYFITAAVVSGLVYNILENDVFTLYYFIILGYAYRFLENKQDLS